MEIFSVEGLNFTYAGADSPALTDISFSVGEGELVLLCGNSGSGKTTLLRLLKPQLTPQGKCVGKVCYKGTPVGLLNERIAAADIGFCSQSPEGQQVCDTVYREMAFGLENIGTPKATAAKRLAETAMFFGIEKLLPRKLSELSGGERQTVNLAAICAMHPQVIILDEPTSQLSPVAAAELLELVGRLRRVLGMTVVMTEHRTEEAFASADRVIWLDKGRIIADLPPQRAAEKIYAERPDLIKSLPAAARIFSMKKRGKMPLDVADGRTWLAENKDAFYVKKNCFTEKKAVLECKNVGFAYERMNTVLYDLNFKVSEGEFFCILGANGAGKTTLLRLLAGAKKPMQGKIKIERSVKTAYLPQNVMPMLREDTLRACLGKSGMKFAVEFGLADLLERHPYDLSGGEMQRAALCLLLGDEPDILLLDEPTKGIDSEGKEKLSSLLHSLCKRGKTVICVTHDVEFAADNADNAAFLFNGSMPAKEGRLGFFSDNVYCSSAAHRITRGIVDGCVSLADLEVSVNEK